MVLTCNLHLGHSTFDVASARHRHASALERGAEVLLYVVPRDVDKGLDRPRSCHRVNNVMLRLVGGQTVVGAFTIALEMHLEITQTYTRLNLNSSHCFVIYDESLTIIELGKFQICVVNFLEIARMTKTAC